MAAMGVKVRERNGAWWIYIDHRGMRKAKRIGTGAAGKKAATQVAQQIQARLAIGHAAFETQQSGETFDSYSSMFLSRIEQTRKHTTHADYRKIVDRDLLPVFRGVDMQEITREKVKALAMGCLQKGQSPKTVQNIIRCLSSLLSHAVEDGLITVNTALKPGKFLPKISKRRKVDPLTREEVSVLLSTTKDRLPRYFPLFLCAVRTGMRMGELLALQWGDIDWQSRFIEVQRNYTHWKLTTPKNGESRRVDMSRELMQTLKDLRTEQQIEAAANGVNDIPEWVFASETGGLLHPHNLRDRVFYGLLTKAKLRKVRFHDLRHTFASLLLQNGESPVYVKDQMGHCSIQVTVDLYGHLIPGGNKQAVDRLDLPVEKPTLAVESATPAQPRSPIPGLASTDRLEIPVVTKRKDGVSDGFRTRDLRIHNPAL
ncbi:putative Phage integrase [Nitrospira lenta]|uniref:Putative Phage integrase n=1 Tax=Nitrospira lenta TaxID=1436998 RepID=A0A330L5V0_9BACT|nr:putative Phage integrase [Nitrospira lenta]